MLTKETGFDSNGGLVMVMPTPCSHRTLCGVNAWNVRRLWREKVISNGHYRRRTKQLLMMYGENNLDCPGNWCSCWWQWKVISYFLEKSCKWKRYKCYEIKLIISSYKFSCVDTLSIFPFFDFSVSFFFLYTFSKNLNKTWFSNTFIKRIIQSQKHWYLVLFSIVARSRESSES